MFDVSFYFSVIRSANTSTHTDLSLGNPLYVIWRESIKVLLSCVKERNRRAFV